jgi:flap endonuclease-1
LAKAGKVYATVSEDMDCLTFGTPVLLRGFSNKDEPVIEINLELALKELEISMDEFIDICILCGCDYCDSIDGIGPTKAYKFIKENKNIEGVLKFVENYNQDQKKKTKYVCPKENFDYEEARFLFKTPEALDPEKIELKWTTPNYEGLKDFLCKQKGFSENRIDSAMKRIEVKFFSLFSLFFLFSLFSLISLFFYFLYFFIFFILVC